LFPAVSFGELPNCDAGVTQQAVNTNGFSITYEQVPLCSLDHSELRHGLFPQLPSIVLTILPLAKPTHVQKYQWNQVTSLLSGRSFRDSKTRAKGTLGQSKVAVLQCIRTVRDDCQALLNRTQIAACAHAVILSAVRMVGAKSPIALFDTRRGRRDGASLVKSRGGATV
jgi:hypothetical protein